jgi:hypothetical protein
VGSGCGCRRLRGYIDYDPDNDDGIEPEDVSISYAVHPWARGQGAAVDAVRLICDILRANQIGTRVASSARLLVRPRGSTEGTYAIHDRTVSLIRSLG